MSTENNLYVTSFLPTAQHDLVKLSQLNEEINQERQAWINSGAAQQLTRFFFERVGVDPKSVPPEKFSERLKFEQAQIFGLVESSPLVAQNAMKLWGQLPAKVRDMVQEIDRMQKEHKVSYQNALRPLTEQKSPVEARLYDNWVEFMKGGLEQVQDFARYLCESEFLPLPDLQRPFLESLARRFYTSQNGPAAALNNLISSGIVEGVLINPSIEFFSDFLVQLQAQKPNRDLQRTQEWLRLISGSQDMDAAVVLAAIQNCGIFPADLKDFFLPYAKDKLATEVSAITAALSDYKPAELKLVASVGSRAILPGRMYGSKKQKHQVQMRNIGQEAAISYEGEIVTIERSTYQIVIGDPSNPSPELLASYAEKLASELSADVPGTRQDILKMMEALKEDPFGLGVSKMIDRTTASLSSNGNLPLRRFRADQRPALNLLNPASRGLRVIFHTEKINGNHVVVIHNVAYGDPQ